MVFQLAAGFSYQKTRLAAQFFSGKPQNEASPKCQHKPTNSSKMKLPSSSVFRLHSSSKMELLKVSPNLCFLEMVNDFFVLVPSTGKLLQAFGFANLSHSEIFDDVLCWCLLQASFCTHFDLSTFLIQKYVMFCVGAFYRQAFASIQIIDAQLLLGKGWCSTTCPKLHSNCVQDYPCHLFL